ncbi:MAG: PD40 domain-containing protein [Anaerolineae bacterium]|nr:PD40 domain-containing protein [Anaerolineae bacterium]
MVRIILLFSFSILLGLVACVEGGSPASTPTVTVTDITASATMTAVSQTKSSTPITIPTRLDTPTSTYTPTNTPISYTTAQPFPTVTPVGVYPIKQVFIQAGWTGGDGGSVQDFYFGRSTPSIVIYTDGQVVMKVGSWEDDFTFLSGQLPPEELCSLLARVQSTGYFNPIDMIYAFDETTQFSDGAGNYVIQINGPINKMVGIYGPYRDYLVDEIAAAYQLVSTYQPPTTISPYVPERLLLWVEPTATIELDSLPNWPDEITPLSELHSDPSSHNVIIEGDLVTPLMELFDYQMAQQIFHEGDQSYKVILRPLLPHETPYSFSVSPNKSAEFKLPFHCENFSLPEVIHTPTPTPLVGTLAPEAGKLQGQIVFASNRDGNYEIYTMYANGSHITRLTNYPGDDTQPVWSPDGQQIAFVSDRPGRDEIYVMNVDGTNVTRLTFSASNKHSPAWSPDSSRIAYVDSHNADFPDFDSEIYVVGLEGNEPIRLTNNGSRVGDITPIWLDQNQIVYASGDYPDFSLYVMQDDGSGQIFLTNGLQPALSSNGERLAYVVSEFGTLDSSHYAEYNKIFVASMSDLISNQNVSAQITLENESNHDPVWSPDGEHIMFVSGRDGNAEIYVMNIDGSNPIRLTFTAATEQSPDWKP